METSQIRARAEAVQDIISREPGFLERWALSIFALLLLLLVGLCWFIKYPDIVQANAELIATDGPKELVIRHDGKIIRLFTKNDDTTMTGQPIAWLESNADHALVASLSGRLDSAGLLLARSDFKTASAVLAKSYRHLGELQEGYQTFMTAYQQFNDYLVNGFYVEKRDYLAQDLNYLKRNHEVLDSQKALVLQDIKLTQASHDANDGLYREKVISTQDYRDSQSKLVSKKMTLPQIESSLLENENQQIGKTREIKELDHDISRQRTVFSEALQTLQSQIDDWDKKYVLRAPTTGKIALTVPIQENQFITAGKTIGYVNPVTSHYFAQVNLSQYNFGKIRLGQTAQLRFDAYPYEEFGYVEGTLAYMSKVPTDSGYWGSIVLPQGMLTSYGRVLQYRAGLKCQAYIVTKNLRVLQRFYYGISKSFQR